MKKTIISLSLVILLLSGTVVNAYNAGHPAITHEDEKTEEPEEPTIIPETSRKLWGEKPGDDVPFLKHEALFLEEDGQRVGNSIGWASEAIGVCIPPIPVCGMVESSLKSFLQSKPIYAHFATGTEMLVLDLNRRGEIGSIFKPKRLSMVKIKMDLPALLGEEATNPAVFHEIGMGIFERLEAVVADDYLCFDADKFSNFVIVYTKSGKPTASAKKAADSFIKRVDAKISEKQLESPKLEKKVDAVSLDSMMD